MLLEVQNLSGGYSKTDICKNISCEVKKGDILCVLGPNGCGKSTFFRLVLGFLKPSSGTVLLSGKNANTINEKELAKHIAYIPQNHSPIFNYTVLDIVSMGRASHLGTFAQPSKKDYIIATNTLSSLGIENLAHHEYTTLSGGQRQLVLIARALCQNANLLIMDEPAASLDYANDQRMIDIVQNLAKQGLGIIVSSHSPEFPFTLANKVLLMKDGLAYGYGKPKNILTSSSLQDVYGLEMDIVTVQDRYNTAHTLCVPSQQNICTK